MAIPTLSGLPAAFESGDTVIFTESFGDYPAGTWTAKVYFSLNGVSVGNVTATADGTNHLFTISAATSGAWTAGTYDYAIYCTSGSERARAKSGRVEILPDLTENQSASDDQRSLTAAKATRTAILGGNNVSVSFNGQAFTRHNLKDLEAIISRLEAKVKAERDRIAGLRGEAPSRCIRPMVVGL